MTVADVISPWRGTLVITLFTAALIIAAQVSPAAPDASLRAVDAMWPVVEVTKDQVRSGELSVPIGAGAAQLSRLLPRSARAQTVLVDIADDADGKRATSLLNRMHRLGFRELALKIDARALAFCQASDATCMGRPWAGVRPVKDKSPSLKVKADSAELRVKGARTLKVDLASDGKDLQRALDGLKDTHLEVLCERCTWGALRRLIVHNPLPALRFTRSAGRLGMGGALSGFDSILGGGLDVAALDVGKKSERKTTGLSRTTLKGSAAGVSVETQRSTSLDRSRGGPTRLEVSIDEDFGPNDPGDRFLKGAGDAITSAAERADKCVVDARSAQKEKDIGGKMTVVFRIVPTDDNSAGRVGSAKISEDRTDHAGLTTCVLEVVKSLTFPKLPEGRDEVVIKNTFFFESTVEERLVDK